MQSRFGPRWLMAGCCLLFTVACEDGTNGPCVHTYRDPVLAITSATDAVTGAAIPSLLITGVSVGGQTQPVGLLLSTSYNARAQGDAIACDVGCGFGTTEGSYVFTASAPGYAPQRLTVAAQYGRFQGGCPSSNEGSTAVVVTLARSAAR